MLCVDWWSNDNGLQIAVTVQWEYTAPLRRSVCCREIFENSIASHIMLCIFAKTDHVIVIHFFLCHISIVVPIPKAFSIILLFVGLETENINKRSATQQTKLWKWIFCTKQRDTYKIDSLWILCSNFELGVLSFSLIRAHTHPSTRSNSFHTMFRSNSSTAVFGAQCLSARVCACVYMWAV